jgi:hypothetical protein
MTSANRISMSIAVALFLTILSPCVDAWSNGGYSADPDNPDYGTHDWIADMALTLQTRDVTFLSATYHSLFLLGTEAPDNPEYIGDTMNHHVYFYASGQLQDDICAQRASQIYQTALDYLLVKDYRNAAYDIGVLTHYVADVGVFGHTMGAYTDWGAEVHHSDYENEIESMIDSLSLPAGLILENSDAYEATLNLAEVVTFGSGTIRSNVWMDTNYDWSDPEFIASARESVFASVSAVAAVINHLLAESATSTPPTPPAPAAEPPSAPTSLTARVQGARVVLAWLPPESSGGATITEYTIFRGKSQSESSYIASVAGDLTSWIDESVSKGDTYYYRVSAKNIAGSGPMSEVVSVTLPGESDPVIALIAIVAASVSVAVGGAYIFLRGRVKEAS